VPRSNLDLGFSLIRLKTEYISLKVSKVKRLVINEVQAPSQGSIR
jgi:hypothetical protein